MKAILNNLRMSPRKVRLVINAVKGKSVTEARALLSFMPKIAATPLLKLLESAVKNAANKNSSSDASLLTIADFHVDSGKTLKRMIPILCAYGCTVWDIKLFALFSERERYFARAL
jgi:large subunit ribosomal protein L22